MAVFQWSNKYSVGVPELDDQHRKLINMAQELFEAIKDKEGKARAVPKVLQELVTYTKLHFTTEERMMAAAGYDKLAEHKQRHAKLIQEVGDFINKYNGGSKDMLLPLMQFLQKWLIEHILQDDKQYSKVLQQAVA